MPAANIGARHAEAFVATLTFMAAVAAHAQTVCNEPHYRWSEKTDTTIAVKTAQPVDVSDMLGWAPRSITSKDKCAQRTGRERNVYSVTGWVRRIKLHEKDQDWHIELTENEDDTPVKASCIIVEIPDPSYGSVYAQARADLAVLVDTLSLKNNGDLDQAVHVRFTGAALFDGYHQTRPANGGPPHASSHGRCNSSVRALWELHPVYRVEAPEEP
jgi:hypothetical protein